MSSDFNSDLDPFWVKARADFLAAKSTAADPSACGTCRGNVAAGEPVEHDGCAQRATLLQAPDHPHYEILAGFSLEENEKLPPRFHVPVFDDLGQPNLWLCAVCQEEGTVVGWPCETAQKYGTQVFTPLHEAETAAKKQAAELERLQDDNVRLVDQQAKDDDEFAQAVAERDRYRLAWKSARDRAESSSETILRVVKDREAYQGWLKQEQAYTQGLRAELAEAVRVSEALNRRLHDEQLAGSALYAAMTMPTSPQERQAALDKFRSVARQVTTASTEAAS